MVIRRTVERNVVRESALGPRSRHRHAHDVPLIDRTVRRPRDGPHAFLPPRRDRRRALRPRCRRVDVRVEPVVVIIVVIIVIISATISVCESTTTPPFRPPSPQQSRTLGDNAPSVVAVVQHDRVRLPVVRGDQRDHLGVHRADDRLVTPRPRCDVLRRQHSRARGAQHHA